MRRLIIFILTSLIAFGCNKPELIDIVHLGAYEKEMKEPSTTAIDTIRLVSDVHYEVEVVEGKDWLTLGATGMFPLSRKEIPFRCEANYGFRRTGKVTLSAASRVDTVYIRQEGTLIDEVVLMEDTFEVSAAGGVYTTEVVCHRYPDALKIDLSSQSMLEAEYKDGFLTVKVAAAIARDPKSYTVDVYYTDGWGERVTAVATFNQKPRL